MSIERTNFAMLFEELAEAIKKHQLEGYIGGHGDQHTVVTILLATVFEEWIKLVGQGW